MQYFFVVLFLRKQIKTTTAVKFLLTPQKVVLQLHPMKKGLTTPTKLRGKRKHGFRVRMSSRSGKRILKLRRKKGRNKLTV